MKKIYGYKEQDLKQLATYVKGNNHLTLSSLFESYAKKHGKAKGTVRNLYYALAKLSTTDDEFCSKYLDGTPVSVNKVVEFKDCEQRALVKKILVAKMDGKSVRSAVMELANGDGKIALRYQNKFRNAEKNNPELITSIISELKAQGKTFPATPKRFAEYKVSTAEFNAVKTSIDSLINKISQKERLENEYLKERVSALELENVRLLALLYGDKPQNGQAYSYFAKNNGEKIVH